MRRILCKSEECAICIYILNHTCICPFGIQLQHTGTSSAAAWPSRRSLSPAMFVLLRFHSLKEKFGPRFRNVIVSIFYVFKLHNVTLRKSGSVCVCVCVCVHEFGAAVEHNVAEDWKALWTLQFVLTRLCSFLPRSDVIRRERDSPLFAGDCRTSMSGQLFARRICVSNTDPGTYCMPGNNEDNQLSNTASRGSRGQGSRYTLELGENHHPFVQ